MSAIGPAGAVPFGWIGLGGGSGGGGGGTGNIKIFTGVVGAAGGPVAGASTWVPAVAAGSVSVPAILLANVPMESISASPGFTWDGTTLSIAPNVFVAGDPVIGWYVAP